MQDWIVPGAAGVLALLALGLAFSLLRARSRLDRELATTRAESAALRAQLDELERRVTRPEPRPTGTEFVITNLGDPEPESVDGEPAPQLGGALFTDLVVRETLVKTASLAHGVRRALAPETRNRIRFEMRREVKRARKQRRADTRRARREGEARERAGLHGDPTGSAA